MRGQGRRERFADRDVLSGRSTFACCVAAPSIMPAVKVHGLLAQGVIKRALRRTGLAGLKAYCRGF